MIQSVIILLALACPHSARMIDVCGLVEENVCSRIAQLQVLAWLARFSWNRDNRSVENSVRR
jgi:hypothetical protein